MLRWILCLLAMVMIIAAPAAAQWWPPELDSVLATAGLNRHTARFDLDAMAEWGGNKYSMSHFERVHRDPWVLPQAITYDADEISKDGGSLFTLLRLAARRTDDGVYRGLIGDPAETYRNRVDSSESPLLDAIELLHERTEIRFPAGRDAMLAKEAKKLKPGVENLLACFVYAIDDWVKWRSLALRKVSAGDTGLRKVLPLRDPGLSGIFSMQTRIDEEPDDLDFAQFYDFLDLIDLPYLYTGALDVAAVCDFVADSAAKLGELTDDQFNWDTPLGRITVGGSGDDVYAAKKKYLLILESGGNDSLMTGGASVNSQYHSGVIIELAGDDTYAVDSTLKVGFGGGLLGLGYVIDKSGDDYYDGGSISLGTGIFGMGGLVDYAGRDTYRGYEKSQGAGLYGVGVLADLDGDDSYYGFNQIQGYGFTKGCGILYDRAGNDRYVADDSTLAYASPQTPEHNASEAQGVGFGLRDDYATGHSLAGGLGYLVDDAGDDSYSAGLFAQGCAYWYSLGVLCDKAGSDTYNGVWYVQGTGAHFGVGVLNDRAGNDTYTATMNMAQGAGHDFTIGMLWDEKGNDTYHAPNLSLGGGNANGIGIFRDDSGDDVYDVSAATTLGRANSTPPGSLRWELLCLGLFLDFEGTDTYPEAKDFARNGATWRQIPPQDTVSAQALGAGIDTEVRDK